MTDSFADLGLSDTLVDVASRYPAPAPLQAAAIPVIRRGGNALLHASAGAGVVAAFGLPLIDRLLESEADPETGPALLVLTPTAQTARAVGGSLARLAETAGADVAVSGAAWRSEGRIAVTTPGRALDDVAGSRLKLGSLQAVVLHGLSSMLALNHAETLDTVLGSLPAEAQRVITTSRVDDDVADFAERHARRALRIPARSLEEPETRAAGSLRVVVTEDKPEALALALADGGPATVLCRTADRAAAVARELALRGLDGDATVIGFQEAPDTERGGRPIGYDPPFDAASLTACYGEGGLIIAAPRELPHVRQLSQLAGLRLETGEPADPDTGDASQFRDRIRATIRDADLTPYMLLLEPVAAEHSMAEIAAAAALLARTGRPAAAAAAARPAAKEATPPTAWARLFISAGKRDDLGPGDILGAITGEAGVSGDVVGKIDLRDTHTTVEVQSGVARKIIAALNGRTLGGRSLRVDYDRSTGRDPGASKRRRRRPR